MAPSSKIQEPPQCPSVEAAGQERQLNAHADIVDLRDRSYEPALLRLALSMDPPDEAPILDQLAEGACTGFAMAAAINLLMIRQKREGLLAEGDDQGEPNRVDKERLSSARMLYEMAKLHDEWPGETYDGSSIRGAMKGFFHNGVCTEGAAPYKAGDNDWALNVKHAKEAREIGLGAYYRLKPKIIDYHAALNEVGAIVVSARVHVGWNNPRGGKIRHSKNLTGGHAFIIVGYDRDGFLVQNSWGPDWGQYDDKPGIAHWSYADWAENVIDAWVMRLAVPTPDAFDLTHISAENQSQSGTGLSSRPAPRRHDVLGHIIHLDDGELLEDGAYGTTLESIEETAKYLADVPKDGNTPKYDHLMLYAHGGLNDSKASAKRVAALKEIFKRNKIYPIHFMWETGFSEELGDVFGEFFRSSQERVGSVRDFLDWTIEKTSRRIGRSVWRQMKSDAVRAFRPGAGGTQAVRALLKANAASTRPLKVHLVGHSAGSILLGELIQNWSKISSAGPKIESVSLMAPACTMDFYQSAYAPALKGGAQKLIKSLWQYNLSDVRELDDSVGPYGKSLLYFVSNSFEETIGEPLLGMETFSSDMIRPTHHKIFYTPGEKPETNPRTDSQTHGGFDNDLDTMNDILRHILGKHPSPAKRFQENELKGY